MYKPIVWKNVYPWIVDMMTLIWVIRLEFTDRQTDTQVDRETANVFPSLEIFRIIISFDAAIKHNFQVVRNVIEDISESYVGFIIAADSPVLGKNSTSHTYLTWEVFNCTDKLEVWIWKSTIWGLTATNAPASQLWIWPLMFCTRTLQRGRWSVIILE